MKTHSVSLKAAFKGVKFIKMPFVIGTNNLNPLLELYQNDIQYRNLFFKSTKRYETIETVDVFVHKGMLLGKTTTNICLYFKNSIFTFVGNTDNLEQLKEVVIFFKDRGCNLSKKAQDLI